MEKNKDIIVDTDKNFRKNVDLTNGSIFKNILLTSWPMTLAFFIQTMYNIVDTIFVGRISAEAIAAVSLAFPVMFFMFALGGGLAVGTSSYIARLYGAKEYNRASNVAEHSLLISVIISIIFSVAGLFLSKPLFSYIIEDNTLDLAVSYMDIIFMGSSSIFLMVAASGILRGIGDMKTSMKAMLISAVINVILDPIFIFTLKMGVRGAAIATIISMIVGMLLLLIHLFKGKSSIELRYKYFKYNPSIIKEIFRVGVPTSFSNIGSSIGLFFINKLVSFYGPLSLAAFGIGFRLESVAIMPAIGIFMATITLVGQNVGAKKYDRAETTTLYAGYLSFAFAFIFSIIYFMFPNTVTSIFTKDLDVIRLSSSYIKIVSMSYMFLAFSFAISGGFLGAGKPMPALTINLLRILILSVILSYVLSFVLGYGLNGIWYGLALSYFLTTIISYIWFKSGSWKNIGLIS